MKFSTSLALLLSYGGLLVLVAGWSKEDYLGVKNSASHEEISKAYRKRSKSIHPDKIKQSLAASKAKPTSTPKSGRRKKPGVHVSKGPTENEVREAIKQASERYARLAVIAAILKGEGRERYDHFLSNGFPKWKGTGYYYARFRPGLGSVLVGLFVTGGGIVHYTAMYLSWKRQREFVERYIRHARRAAWGDESGVKGIFGMNGVGVTLPPASAQDEGDTMLNRRQKRLQIKESKKEKDKKKPRLGHDAGISTPSQTESEVGPQGQKKRVQAENGKVLIVDSVGNVFLEEEDENGEKCEYLLDPDEISRPTIQQTVLVRLPVWIHATIWNRFVRTRVGTEEDTTSGKSTSLDVGDHVTVDATYGANGNAKKRGKRQVRLQ
ncbi:hypothetical protein MMC07_009230 [Pseudocyphellaria aurata]|nr:hypothetical protein [Pseudocyphellaria aurata]